MSKIQPIKRIIVEDFDPQYRTMVGKLGSAINLFADDVYGALNNNLSIEDNFNQGKKTLTITVDASGIPIISTVFKSNLGRNCYGIQVVRAVNNTTPSNYPSSTPFINFSENSGLITVNKITGLTASNQYSLSLILY